MSHKRVKKTQLEKEYIQRIHQLEEALRPFARFTMEEKRESWEIFLPVEGDVWFYVGKAAQVGTAHLHTDNFQLVRKVLFGR